MSSNGTTALMVFTAAIMAAVGAASSRADMLFGGGSRHHVLLAPFYFEMDKSTLSRDAMSQADKVVNHMKSNLDSKVTLDGHVCEPSTAEYALALGDRRAASVKAYMVGKGIDASRIKTRSSGRAAPSGVHRDDAHNCRVDLSFDE